MHLSQEPAVTFLDTHPTGTACVRVLEKSQNTRNGDLCSSPSVATSQTAVKSEMHRPKKCGMFRCALTMKMNRVTLYAKTWMKFCKRGSNKKKGNTKKKKSHCAITCIQSLDVGQTDIRCSKSGSRYPWGQVRSDGKEGTSVRCLPRAAHSRGYFVAIYLVVLCNPCTFMSIHYTETINAFFFLNDPHWKSTHCFHNSNISE